jgi:hypothetical protein
MPIAVESVTVNDFMSYLNNLSNPILNELVNDDSDYEVFKSEDNSLFEKLFSQDKSAFDLFKLVYYLTENNFSYNTEKMMLYDSTLNGIYNATQDYDTDAFFDFFSKETYASDLLM